MRSLNQRILLSTIVVLLLAAAGTAFILDRAFHDNALAALREHMLGKLYLLMGEAEVDVDGNLSMPPEFMRFPELNQLNSGKYAFVIDSSQNTVWRSTSMQDFSLPDTLQVTNDKQFERAIINHSSSFIYRFRLEWETASGNYPFIFHVGINSTLFDERVRHFQINLWKGLAVIVVLLLLTQIMILRWGLRPLRQVAQELNLIESGTQEMLTGKYPEELRRLTNNINSFINHERKQQQRYQHALSDLAHSLKTPLAVLQNTITTDPNPQALQQQLGEQIQRMNAIVHYQLQRAATVGYSPTTHPVLLRPAVEKIIQVVSRAHRDKQMQTIVQIDPALHIHIDEGDLMELLGNLIDNAFKWARDTVSVYAFTKGSQISIKIQDNGSGIKPDLLDLILKRGVRADQSIPGNGIGLAIVQDILQVINGQLSIESNQLTGTCITIKFNSVQS